MTNNKVIVFIVIPTYNEKDNIGRLIDYLYNKVFGKISKKYQMNILVVDDSSPDGTIDIVKNFQKKYKNIYLKINKKKMGLGTAYMSGMNYAIDHFKADILFEMDADFSHDPKLIPKFINKISQGDDLVLGSRYIAGGSIPNNWGWHRKFLSFTGNLTIQIVMGYFRIKDWTTGYRAINRRLFLDLREEMSSTKFSGYTFQVGFLHKALRKGYKIGEIPLKFIDREYGKSKLGMEYIKNTLIYIILVRIKELERVIKFALVGGIGSLVQLVALSLYRSVLPDQTSSLLIANISQFQLALFLAIETSVISNFIWSNVWTFADRKLKLAQVPLKFLQFNLASAGSILIQLLVGFLGETFIGLKDLFFIPLTSIMVDTGVIFAIVGILIGMFWNFFAYDKIVWKEK